MQLRNVRIEIDENNVEQYIGEFVFNVELAQDLSSMFTHVVFTMKMRYIEL